MKTKNKKPFDKYFYYKASVQGPEDDIKFFAKTYQSIYKKPAHIFCEDFCGTFWTGLNWVQAHPKNKAIVIDISAEPLNYGKKHHLPELDSKDRTRIKVLQKSVLDSNLPKSEIIAVNNFSYYVFKERLNLLKYFKNARLRLKKQGLFIIDTFGGSACLEPNEESVQHKGFTYYWDQQSFDPITNYGKFYIHFKRNGEAKREKVFSYDWRVWSSLPELRDILLEAGFSKVHTYWEKSDKKGWGTGEFNKIKKTDEICETWIAYFVCQN